MARGADVAVVQDWLGEPTLVIHGHIIDWPWVPINAAGRLFKLSCALHQDCIAVMDDDHHGALIGPSARAWGKFDSSRFIEIEEAIYLGTLERFVAFAKE